MQYGDTTSTQQPFEIRTVLAVGLDLKRIGVAGSIEKS